MTIKRTDIYDNETENLERKFSSLKFQREDLEYQAAVKALPLPVVLWHTRKATS